MTRPLYPLASLLALAALLVPAVGCATDGAGAADPASELVTEGRALLDSDQPEEAERLFTEAGSLEGDSLRTRLWVVRAWMDQGRINDALREIDRLRDASGEERGSEIDYLYGMAFARSADTKVGLGVTDASVQMNYEDATAMLGAALASDPDRFRDGYLPLARAAWMTQDLERARTAAEQAVQYYAHDADAWTMLGRVSLSQFQTEHTSEPWGSEASAHWQRAREAFEQAAVELSPPADMTDVGDLAAVRVQLGHTLLWKELVDEACAAYAEAIAWAPETVDYAQLQRLLSPEAFNATLERGHADFVAREGAQTGRDPALLWWLGWSRFSIEEYVPAEEALLAAVEQAPGYVNAWFYVALTRYAREDYEGTIEALRSGWEADPATIVASMESDEELNITKLGFVIGWCAEAGRTRDAAFLCRINAETAPEVASHWNDLGLFLRDSGEALAKADPTDPTAPELFELAYEAYQRALELAPEDPQLLNDTAVMLDYYLDRDLDRALAMYERAQTNARALLEVGLAEDELGVVETALEDATNNAERLRLHLQQGRG